MDDDDDGEIGYEQEQFEDSPRQKLGTQGVQKEREAEESLEKKPEEDNYEDDDDANEDEVIDVAERIFIRIAEQIINREIKTVREVFADYIIAMELDG